MPQQPTEAEQALEKLGQRLRAGYAKQHPAQSLDTVREAVREQYEQEQEAARQSKPKSDVAKDQERQPPEPDPER
jgi:hypothetical protein